MTVHVAAASLILGLWFALMAEGRQEAWRLRWWFRAGVGWMLVELVAWRQMEAAVGRLIGPG